jgi:glycosyltransferase involved in cell wall biosynthesis
MASAGHTVSVFSYGWSGLHGKLDFVQVNRVEDLRSAAAVAAPDVLILQCYIDAAEKISGWFPGTRKLYWDHVGVNHRFRRLITSRHLDQLICVSQTAKELFRSTSAYPYTQAIYNLVSDAYFESGPRQSDGRTIVFAGALRTEKGFDRLAVVWPAIHAAFPSVKLAIAGSISLHRPGEGNGALADGDYQTEVIEPFQAWAKAANANVSFLGTVGPRELAEIHSRAVACVANPFGGETFCCGAVEAQLCGVPVVSVFDGALPEVTASGVTSLLVERGSPQALSNAILCLLRNPAGVETMGEAARCRARGLFGPETIMASWERAIRGQSPPSSPLPLAPLGVRMRRDLLRLTRAGDWIRRRREIKAVENSDSPLHCKFDL